MRKVLINTRKKSYFSAIRLWSYHKKKLPNVTDVSHAWLELIEEEKSDAIKEILQLSIGQKAVLVNIAKGVSQLTNNKSIVALQMSSSSIMSALEGVEEKDIIEKDGKIFQIINPVIKFYVLKSIK